MPGEAIVTIKDKQWSCSVTSTPAELATGLSGVPIIPPGTGMLFVLPQEQIVTVTAEGMLFPLSIIFIGDNLQVTEVARILAPGDTGTTGLPCRYFLEVNAGEADGIEAGDQVAIAFSTPTTNWIAPVVTFAGVVMVGAMMAKMGKTMADAMLGKLKERPVLYGPRGERLLPQTTKQKYLAILDKGDTVFQEGETVSLEAYERENERVRKLGQRSAYGKHLGDIIPPRKPTRHDVTVEAWQERDRMGIWITDKRTGKTIAEWWDEDAREMFEQGFFKPGVPRYSWEKPGREFVESVLDYAESVGLLAGGGKYLPQTIRDAYYWTAINKDTGEIVESHAPYTSSVRALSGGKAFASRHWKGESLVEVWRQPYRYSEKLKIQPVASETITVGLSPAVIPTEPRPRRSMPDEMEFLADSPEFLAYTIEDIGYREKIDNAFQNAIARARKGG